MFPLSRILSLPYSTELMPAQTSNIGPYTYHVHQVCLSLPLDLKLLERRNCLSFVSLQCLIKYIAPKNYQRLLNKVSEVTHLPFHNSTCTAILSHSSKQLSASSCPWVYPSSTLCKRSCLTSGPRTCRWWPQLSDPGVWSLYTEWVTHSAPSYRILDFPKGGKWCATSWQMSMPRKRRPFGQGLDFFRYLKDFSCTWSFS